MTPNTAEMREMADRCDADANYILRRASSVGTSGDVEHYQRAASMLRAAADTLDQPPPETLKRLDDSAVRRLHDLLADVHGLIDPEAHPEIHERIMAELGPCDEAGTCPASPVVPPQVEPERIK